MADPAAHGVVGETGAAPTHPLPARAGVLVQLEAAFVEARRDLRRIVLDRQRHRRGERRPTWLEVVDTPGQDAGIDRPRTRRHRDRGARRQRRGRNDQPHLAVGTRHRPPTGADWGRSARRNDDHGALLDAELHRQRAPL